MAAARGRPVQADAAAPGAQGRPQPQARSGRRDDPAGADRGVQARPHPQPGCIPHRHRLDAADQGNRQADPARPGRHRTEPRRGLDRLRPDAVAAVGDGGAVPARRRARGGESSRLRTRRARRPARETSARHRHLLCRHGVAGSHAAHRAARGRRRASSARTVRQPAAGAAGVFAAASLLSRRGLGRGHVPGLAPLEDHAQFPHRHGRPRSRQYAPVRGDRRRRVPADRLQGQSAYAVRAGARGRRLAFGRRVPRGNRALSCRRRRALRHCESGTGEDHGAAHLSPSRGGNPRASSMDRGAAS